MTYIVRASFKAKSGEIKKGQVITMREDKARALLVAGQIAELKACHICQTFAWWLSIHGALVCGVCHPPVACALVKRWIGDRDTLKRIKDAAGI